MALKRDRCGARSIPFLTASLLIFFSSKIGFHHRGTEDTEEFFCLSGDTDKQKCPALKLVLIELSSKPLGSCTRAFYTIKNFCAVSSV
jgi:hypothetical protein